MVDSGVMCQRPRLVVENLDRSMSLEFSLSRRGLELDFETSNIFGERLESLIIGLTDGNCLGASLADLQIFDRSDRRILGLGVGAI